MKARHGHSLVELLATLATLSALLIVAGGLFRLASRTATMTANRAEALDATRTAAALLDRELRPLAAGDLTVFTDSIPLRAFRGYAVPCDSAGGGAVRVRHTGLRPPDPTKDSIVALGDTSETTAALSAANVVAAGATCQPLPGEQILSLATSAPLPASAVWLVFERGTYSISTNTLRYRRGFGGRQPVTAASFNDATSGFAITAAPVALELMLTPAHARATSFALPAKARVPLPNMDTVPAP